MRNAAFQQAIWSTLSAVPEARVISYGDLAFPENSEAYLRQRKRLEVEGLKFTGGKLNYLRYRWPD